MTDKELLLKTWEKQLGDHYIYDPACKRFYFAGDLWNFSRDLIQAATASERARVIGILEKAKWPEWVSKGQGGMFGSAGWDTANSHAVEAHNKDIDSAVNKIKNGGF